MNEPTLEEYSRLVGLVYEAGLDSRRWQVFVDHLASVLGKARVVMQAHDLEANLSLGHLSNGYDPAFVAAYEQYYAATNVWVPAIAAMPLGRASTPEAFVPRSELLKSEYYNDWARPQRIDTAAGLILHRDTRRVLIVSANISLEDEEEKKPLAVRLLDLLAPHLYRSFEVARRTVGADTVVPHQLLDVIPDPSFVLDARGYVVGCNDTGAKLFRDPQIAKLEGGSFCFVDYRATNKLNAALGSLATGDYLTFEGAFPVDVPEGFACHAKLTPCAVSDRQVPRALRFLVEGAPVALLRLELARSRKGLIGLLRSLYGLTDVEAQLAIAIADGASVADFAQRRGTSVVTARNQLRAVFDKTDTHRQVELTLLVRQLERLPG